MKNVDAFQSAGHGVQVSDVRQANQRVILTLIARNPGSSAAQLSELSKLAPQTVGLIIDELNAAGLLRAEPVIRGRRGQPARPFSLNDSGAFAIGVELGWRHFMVALVRLGGEVVSEYRRDYLFPDPATIFGELADAISRMRSLIPGDQESKFAGVGLAAPNGIGRNVSLLGAGEGIASSWAGIDPRAALELASGATTVSYNDGNAACWGELGVRPNPKPANLVYMHVGTFVGAGIIAQGLLWEGPTGNSANLGSMVVTDRRGEQKTVHQLASLFALEQRLKARGSPPPPLAPACWPWGDLEPTVTEWLDDAASAIAKAVINAQAVFEFDCSILDGDLPPKILDRLLGSVGARLARMPALTVDPPTVAKGHLGASAASVGAAYLVLFRRFFSRDWVSFAT